MHAGSAALHDCKPTFLCCNAIILKFAGNGSKSVVYVLGLSV
jgi:hypothetical protein